MNEDLNNRVSCNLCCCLESRVRFRPRKGGSKDGDTFYNATTDKFGILDTIHQCLKCGLVYSTQRLNAEEMLKQYRENEDKEYMAESDSRSINAYLSLARIRRYMPSGRLLEVGCGTGYFLNAARLSYEVIGVEPSNWASCYAKENLKLDIIPSTLEEARLANDYFDVVVLIDVIEHVSDPSGLLREINRVTKPDGILYVMTPNIDSFSARLLGSKWWGLRPAHIFYFSRKTLSELLTRCGYRVISTRSYGRIFTWQYWLTRLSNYPRIVYRLVERLIELFGIEDKFLYIDTRDSVQIIARKKS